VLLSGYLNEHGMQRYRNLSGVSGVVAYEIADEAITVKFTDGGTYVYSYASAGRPNVEQMKLLARAGKGLSTFISQNVQKAYASKRDGAG
jgi:hypothetical protein